jgi:hypothetical protein
MAMEKIEEIKKLGQSAGSEKATEEVDGVANKDHFQALMLQQDKQKQHQEAMVTQKVETVEPENKKPSLMDQVADLNRKVDQVKKVQPTDIVAQAQDVMSRMSQIKEQLALPDQSIKPAYRDLLKNKLTHINDNLRIALSAAGVESVPPTSQTASNNPIDRFLGFLTDGQAQLQSISKEVEYMHLNKNNLNAASMLAVQIKVGFIQQELEFFSSVLNKALESTKTIMNVQV